MEMVIFEIVSATKSICFLSSMPMFLVMSIMTCRKMQGGFRSIRQNNPAKLSVTQTQRESIAFAPTVMMSQLEARSYPKGNGWVGSIDAENNLTCCSMSTI